MSKDSPPPDALSSVDEGRARRITARTATAADKGKKQIPETIAPVTTVTMEEIEGLATDGTLRAREIRFCHAFFDGASWPTAYKESHPHQGDTKEEIGKKAKALSEQPRIIAYIQHLKDKESHRLANSVHVEITPGVNSTSPIIELKNAMEMMEEEAINLSPRGQTKKLEIIYWYAMAQGKYNAAIGAVKAQNELAGFLTQRHEVTVNSISAASDEDLEQMKLDAERELIELGLNPKSGAWEMPLPTKPAMKKAPTPVTPRTPKTPPHEIARAEVTEIDDAQEVTMDEDRIGRLAAQRAIIRSGGGNGAALESKREDDKQSRFEDDEDWA
ncbi:MAG: hypothetical protein ACXWYM_00405 [Candidatus Binatia bacterium]